MQNDQPGPVENVVKKPVKNTDVERSTVNVTGEVQQGFISETEETNGEADGGEVVGAEPERVTPTITRLVENAENDKPADRQAHKPEVSEFELPEAENSIARDKCQSNASQIPVTCVFSELQIPVTDDIGNTLASVLAFEFDKPEVPEFELPEGGSDTPDDWSDAALSDVVSWDEGRDVWRLESAGRGAYHWRLRFTRDRVSRPYEGDISDVKRYLDSRAGRGRHRASRELADEMRAYVEHLSATIKSARAGRDEGKGGSGKRSAKGKPGRRKRVSDMPQVDNRELPVTSSKLRM